MRTILISPTNTASKRTRERIKQHGPTFTVEDTNSTPDGQWLLRSGPDASWRLGWLGWLPRNEFHVECMGEKFIEKVLAN